MAQEHRNKIGLVLYTGKGWMGGVYYITNILSALNSLPDKDKPNIVLFYFKKAYIDAVKSVDYPNIEYIYVKENILLKAINKLALITLNRFLIVHKDFSKLVKTAYPFPYYSANFSKIKDKYVWIPDFQEKYYPEFFSKRGVSIRDKNYRYVAKNQFHVVFSSQNACDDFKKFYFKGKNKLHILRFCSSLPDMSGIDAEIVKAKYGLTGKYFVVANQLWKHKNHMIVFKAMVALKEKTGKLNFRIVLTGNEADTRQPDYIKEIETYILSNDLSDAVTFLGMIDRTDQLVLLKNSIAIIQPSLFEGWSTIVEEAKALNKVIFVSDIPIHREQINQNCAFFDPYIEYDLMKLLENYSFKDPKTEFVEHNSCVTDFAYSFMKLFG